MIELKRFKKCINDFLVTKKFKKKGNYYYLFFNEIIIVIGIQKSSYSNGCYINLGYIVCKLKPTLSAPRDVDGDVRARFYLEVEGKRINFFELDTLSEDELNFFLEKNVEHYIENVDSLDQLKKLIEKNPVMLYQTSLALKEMLGFPTS